MGTALDVERTARELADVAVPDFADAIVIEIKEEVFDERIGPVGPAWLARVRRRRVLVYEGVGAVPDLVRAGASAPGRTDSRLSDRHARRRRRWHSGRHQRGRQGADPLRRRRRLLWQPPAATRSWCRCGPARRCSAWCTSTGTRTGPPFEPEDVEVAEEITTRAAVSIDNGRLYDRERTTALMLQRALLPERIRPARGAGGVPGLPGSVGAEVGGDWFDVIELSGARVALVVGDVMGVGGGPPGSWGSSARAARTLAGLDLAPAQVLHQLDELGASLSREPPGDATSTRSTTRRPASSRVSRAGHPPPLLLSPDGTVGRLDVPPSPPLGVGGGAYRSWVSRRRSSTSRTAPGLAFYTDGMVEDKGRRHRRGHRGDGGAAGELPPALARKSAATR